MAIRTAFLFPGQGSHAVGMTRGFTSDAAKAVFERGRAVLGIDIHRLSTTSSATMLTRTEVAQPAIFGVSVAAAMALREHGIRPDIVAGHSLGELAAAVASDALSVDDGFRLVDARARAMARAARARPGGMAAILGLSIAAVEHLCSSSNGDVTIANVNAPEQIVVSGSDHALATLAADAKRQGARRVIRLDVSIAAHSPAMAPAEDTFRAAAAAVAWHPPRAIFVSAVTGRPEHEPDLPNLLADAITAPVRWTEAMASVGAAGASVLIEVGPGRVLSGLARRSSPGCTVIWVGSDEEAARAADLTREASRVSV